MIGLIIPNASSASSLSQYEVKVDEIDFQTGIDFFPELDDQLENQLEGETITNSWKF